ncbi:MAG: hypothetical protein RJA35_1062 [Actinomycetota bacterium]
MSAHFKKVSENEKGYNPADVDAWVERAREQFANPASHVLDARSLRGAEFSLVKGGYEIAAVDTALDRLDDAFAAQEANRMLVRGGHQGAAEHLAGIRQVLEQRLQRGKRKVFDRTGLVRKGYSVRQVDALLAVIEAELSGSQLPSVATLRAAAFSLRWSGYNEAQVDAFIDRVIQYSQLSRTLG